MNLSQTAQSCFEHLLPDCDTQLKKPCRKDLSPSKACVVSQTHRGDASQRYSRGKKKKKKQAAFLFEYSHTDRHLLCYIFLLSLKNEKPVTCFMSSSCLAYLRRDQGLFFSPIKYISTRCEREICRCGYLKRGRVEGFTLCH